MSNTFKMYIWILIGQMFAVYFCIIASVFAECPENCECADDSDVCTSCQKWYIYQTVDGEGRCENYLDKISLPSHADMTLFTKGPVAFVNFTTGDIKTLPLFGVNYYYYGVQYKSVEDQTNNSGEFVTTGKLIQHHNTGSRYMINFEVILPENEEVYLRVALFRRVQLRGWMDVSDSTEAVTVLSGEFIWHWHDGSKYLLSKENGLSPLNFQDASTYCQNLGGNLTSILNKPEHDFIATFRYRGWIGLTVADPVFYSGSYACSWCESAFSNVNNSNCLICLKLRSRWIWTDGRPVTNMFWKPTRPISSCSWIDISSWNSNGCHYIKDFICKMNVNRTTSTDRSMEYVPVNNENLGCTDHCVCDDNGKCTSCEKWFLFSAIDPRGRCANHLDQMSLPAASNVTQITIRNSRLTVDFRTVDLGLPTYSADYYFYGLQYKPVEGSADDGVAFIDYGEMKQHYDIGEPQLMTFTASLAENTSYYVRVALYRKVELLAWQDLCDATEPITITTKDHQWIPLGENEFMFSEKHSLPKLDFYQASAFCQLVGGNLASILSKNDFDFIKNNSPKNNYVWIGLAAPNPLSDCINPCNRCKDVIDKNTNPFCHLCIQCRSQYTWIDGSPVTNTFWSTDDPDNNDECVAIKSVYYDRGCHLSYSFICKRAINETREENSVMTTEDSQSGMSESEHTEHCSLSDDNGCTSCQRWYIYSALDPKGRCVNFLDTITLPLTVEISQGDIKGSNVTVTLKSVDLPLPVYGADYYFYRLQFKSAEDTEGDFTDIGDFHQHYNYGGDHYDTLSAVFMENTTLQIRLAFYRRVELRGWLELCDTTEAITVTTGSYQWIPLGEHEFLFSKKNLLPKLYFDEASALCQTVGGNLTSILSKKEYDLIDDNLPWHTGVWIGLTASKTSGCVGSCEKCNHVSDKSTSPFCHLCIHCRSLYTWIDGRPVTITFWANNEPDGNSRCAALWTPLFTFYDISCSTPYYFICRRAMNAASTKDDDLPVGSISQKEHCEDGDSNECFSCQKWYIYSALNPKGKCVYYLESLSLPSGVNFTGIVERNKVTVNLKSADLPIPPYGSDYYFYGIQYKELNDQGNFKDAGDFVQHYNGEEGTVNLAAELKDNTTFYIRVALYRRVELRGWLDVSDTTKSIILTTESLNWMQYGDNLYMISNQNSIANKNFEGASNYCNLLGSDLASILTFAENEFLNDNQYYGLIGYVVPDSIDITGCPGVCSACSTSNDKAANEDCIRCLHCRSLWTWLDESPTAYTFWGDEFPSGASSHRCTQLCTGGHWCDVDCSKSYPFICKRGITESRFTSTPMISDGVLSTSMSFTTEEITTSTQVPNPVTLEGGLTSSVAASRDDGSWFKTTQTLVSMHNTSPQVPLWTVIVLGIGVFGLGVVVIGCCVIYIQRNRQSAQTTNNIEPQQTGIPMEAFDHVHETPLQNSVPGEIGSGGHGDGLGLAAGQQNRIPGQSASAIGNGVPQFPEVMSTRYNNRYNTGAEENQAGNHYISETPEADHYATIDQTPTSVPVRPANGTREGINQQDGSSSQLIGAVNGFTEELISSLGDLSRTHDERDQSHASPRREQNEHIESPLTRVYHDTAPDIVPSDTSTEQNQTL